MSFKPSNLRLPGNLRVRVLVWYASNRARPQFVQAAIDSSYITHELLKLVFMASLLALLHVSGAFQEVART